MTSNFRFSRRIAVAALLAAFALGACGGDDSAVEDEGGATTTAAKKGADTPTTAAGSSAEATDKVTIKGFKFGPASASAKIGDSITWTNEDSAVHTVVADDKTFESKDLAQGDTFSFTFEKAGTFAYKCGIHNSMKGTVVVS